MAKKRLREVFQTKFPDAADAPDCAVATDTRLGFMSAADKTKLDGLVGPDVPATRMIATTAPLTGGGDLSADRTLAITAATDVAPGSMAAADKAKLDAIAPGTAADTRIVATSSGNQRVVLGPDPTFPQYGGVWMGITEAQITDANAVLEASSLGDVFLNAGRTAAGAGNRSINLEFDGGTLPSDSAFIALRTAAPGNQVQISFFGKLPTVPLPAAFTMTYALNSRVNAALTAAAVVTTPAALVSYGYTQAQADSIPVAINALIADVLNIKKVLTQILQDLQAYGLEQ